MTTTEYNKASQAYDRYAAVTDYKNFLGLPMPAFDELTSVQQKAWLAVATPSAEQEELCNALALNIGRTYKALDTLQEIFNNYVVSICTGFEGEE